jgi:hypothetical protein
METTASYEARFSAITLLDQVAPICCGFAYKGCMENEKLKQVLLFLLQTARSHEREIHDLTVSELALTDAALPPRPAEVWEKYVMRRDEITREKNDEETRRLAQLDALIREVHQLTSER